MKKWKEKGIKWIRELELSRQEKLQIMLIAIGSILLAILLQYMDSQPFEDILLRNTYGGGDRQEILEVELESDGALTESDTPITIQIELEERAYSIEELEEVFAEHLEELDTIILGENESADCIYYPLNLVESLESGAIEVKWTWSPYDLLDVDGEIQQAYVEESGSILELTGTLIYGEEEVQYIQNLCIYPEPKGELETFISKLEDMIIGEEAVTREEEGFVLPEEVDGVSLTWYQQPSYRGVAILMMGLSGIMLLLLRREEEKKRNQMIRNEQMIKDYPQVLHTFVLYIGAGMTVKNAWKRIIVEYEEKGECRAAYEEMKTAYYEMMNGVSEIECYEKFGQRCGLRCYQRFALLLGQNIRKGTKGLTEVLNREATDAFEERKNGLWRINR